MDGLENKFASILMEFDGSFTERLIRSRAPYGRRIMLHEAHTSKFGAELPNVGKRDHETPHDVVEHRGQNVPVIAEPTRFEDRKRSG